jgi:probable rRNA maturation factor
VLHVDIIVDPGTRFEMSEPLAALLRHAWMTLAGEGEWELTLRLATDETIAALHQAYFGDPTPTDVISFPSGDTLALEAGYLGDIVISVDTAAQQAADVGHSQDREVAFLALHGLLHLLGHDDRTDAERMGMLAWQEQLLDAFERDNGRSW